TRLSINVGGESLISLTYPDGDTIRFGLDPYHEEFPLKARRFDIATDSVARLPFGQPVRAPHLNRANLVWLDLPVHRLNMLLTQVAEAVSTLGNHEVVPHLLDAAEATERALDWPSSTQDYIARFADHTQQRSIWQLPKLIDDPAALNQAQRASVVAAHKALVDRLVKLRERFPQQGE